jgi:hypothetical protein
MTETDTAHPALSVVVHGIDVLALVVVGSVSVYLTVRLVMSLPACPLAPVGALQTTSPYCVMNLREPAPPVLSPGFIDPLMTRTNRVLLVVALGAGVIHKAIRSRWRSLRQRERSDTPGDHQ